MHNKTDDITAEEESGVSAWQDPADGSAIDDNDATDGQIDSRSDKDRSDRQCDEVPEEIVPVERVSVHEVSRHVTERLSDQPKSHHNRERLDLVPPAEIDVRRSQDGHDGQVEAVTSDAGTVMHVTPFFDRAGLQGADEALDVILWGAHDEKTKDLAM